MNTIINFAVALSHQSDAFDNTVTIALKKVVAKQVADKLTLEDLRKLYGFGHGACIEGLARDDLTAPALTKLGRRIDPHNSSVKGMIKATLVEHVLSLTFGECDPEPPPAPKVKKAAPRARTKTTAPAVSFIDAVKIPDVTAREAALKKLTVAALKAGIKSENVHPYGVPPKARKDALVWHVQNAIKMGWPRPLDILASS